MAKVLFKRKTTDEINQLEVEDGALIYNTDNGKTYMDFGDNRIQTGGNADTMIAIGGEEPTDEDIKIWIKDKDNQNYNNFYYRKNDNKLEQMFLQPTGDTLPIGAITEFGGETAPTNWLFCNGQAVSRETYAELFSVIGTTYGEGDGSTTFNVPDFSSRSPMGVGTGTDGTNSETTTLGQEKGEYKHKLTENEIPPLITYAPSQTSGGNMAYLNNWSGYNGSGLGTTPITKTKTTNAKAHNTVHPVLGVNYIIKAKQSIGLVGNVVSDMNAQGDNDVAPTKVIKDYVDNKQTYSTDEIVVGTYLGKPLYRKVINTGTLNLSTSELLLDIGITNVDKVRTIEIMMYYTIGSIWYKNWNITELSYKKPNNKISLVGSKNSTFSDSYITIEYTKTTDEVAK